MQDSESRESNQVIVFVQELCGLLAIRQELAAMYVRVDVRITLTGEPDTMALRWQ